MFGIGTIVNTISIVVAGFFGAFIGRFINKNIQDGLRKACGVATIFIGIAGGMEGMLTIKDGSLISGKSMLIVACLALGTLIGEIINIEKFFENFGEFLKKKTGNSKDSNFVNAFLTATFTICIGAMAVVGAIQDGLLNNPTTLYVKSVLDFVMILVLTSSMGKGAAFSAIPVFIFQGSIVLLSRFILGMMTTEAIAYLSLIGSILIFCVGINLIWDRTIRIANMLPSLVLGVLAAYFI